MNYTGTYVFRTDFKGWTSLAILDRMAWNRHRLAELESEMSTGIVQYLINGYREQQKRLRVELYRAKQPFNVGRRGNQPATLTKSNGEKAVRVTKKAPIWFVFVKNGTKCYGKVYGFVEKNGVSAQDRARAYAKKLALRSPSKRVYVARPRVHFTQTAASAARMVSVEI